MDKLHITGNGKKDQTYALAEHVYTIGRLPDNDIVLPDDSVSSRHARLERQVDGWQIIDLESTNGTYLNQQEIAPHKPQSWSPHEPLFIGPYSLLWQPEKARVALDAGQPETTVPDPTQIGNLGSIQLEPITIALLPGGSQTIMVTAVNEARHVEQYTIEVDGLPRNWVSFSETRVQLMPDMQKTTFQFQIQVPQKAEALTYPYRLILRSVADSREEGCAYGHLFVTPVYAYKAVLKPKTIQNRGNCQVVIQNEGNAPAKFLVTGYSESTAVQFDESTQAVTIPAGQEERVVLGVSAAKRPFVGTQTESQPFNVDVVPQKGEAQSPAGNLVIRPWLSQRMLTALALLLVLSIGCTSLSFNRSVESAILVATQEVEKTVVWNEGQTATATAVAVTAEAATAESIMATSTQSAVVTESWTANQTATVDASDVDNDGLTYAEEIVYKTDPNLPDTDYDNLSDSEEIMLGTNPLNPDTDEDGLNDDVDPNPRNPEPTATPLPEDPNILPNPSFEGNHYHPQDENGNEILELQVPEGWFLETFDGDNSLQGAGFFYRPEARVLQSAFLPEEERDMFVFDGDFTLKIFKGDAPTAFTLFTQVNLQQPGRYRLTINLFPDVVSNYVNGEKVFVSRAMASEVSLIYGAGLSTNWGEVIPGIKQTVTHEFIVEAPGLIVVGASFRNRFAVNNNGWFLDDWSLRLIQPLQSEQPPAYRNSIVT